MVAVNGDLLYVKFFHSLTLAKVIIVSKVLKKLIKRKNVPLNNVPNDWSQYFALGWVFILSIWGGTVHTIKKVRDGVVERFTFREWVYDIVTSGFIGFVTYAFCQYANFDGWLSAVLIGISSHQGTRGLLIIENWITNKVGGVK